MCKEGEYEDSKEDGRDSSGGDAKAICSGTPWNDGNEGNGEKFKEHGKLCAGRGGRESAEKQGTCACPVPRLAEKMEYVIGTCGGGEGSADKGESNDRGRKNGKAAKQGLRGGTRSTETGINK